MNMWLKKHREERPPGEKKSIHRIRVSYDRFLALLTLAEKYFAARDFPISASLAQIAARTAFPNHIGLFGSVRLERLLGDLGRQIPSRISHMRNRSEGRRNILHVLSYGRPVGGDSRFVWRWIQEDSRSCHSVAVTSQGIYDVPDVLKQSAEASGGSFYVLSDRASEPLAKALELRAICQGMDIVSLNLFPYDIVPVLALSAGCDHAKTLLVNHSDHTFWIGASVAHSVVHLRKQSEHFLRLRRRLNVAQAQILPIPLSDAPPPSLTRLQAKRALGYAPDTVLLLTIASPFKYSSSNQIGFLDLVSPVLAELPQAVLAAIGPEPRGEWQSAALRTNGRIIPMGTRWDTDLFYSAADVYLDSVPFSSITSLLEAGSQGIPLLGFRSRDAQLHLLSPSAPGLDDAMVLTSSPQSYQSLLTRLVLDSAFREEVGRRVQTQILSLHTGRNWAQALDHVYDGVEQQGNQRGCVEDGNDVFCTTSLDTALAELYGHQKDRRLFQECIELLPKHTILRVILQMYREGINPSPLGFLGRKMRTSMKIAKRFFVNSLEK